MVTPHTACWLKGYSPDGNDPRWTPHDRFHGSVEPEPSLQARRDPAGPPTPRPIDASCARDVHAAVIDARNAEHASARARATRTCGARAPAVRGRVHLSPILPRGIELVLELRQ